MDESAKLAREWWRTSIIDMSPGVIRLRGYPIQEIIGTRGFVDTIWLMLRGEFPTESQSRLLESALVASVDHGPQAPSIAIARMAITSGNAINHAMGSAVTVLGDTHGGAGQQCMELFARIRELELASGSTKQAVNEGLEEFRAKNGRFVPGYGHRFHPVDPRAPRLMSLVGIAEGQKAVDGHFRRIGVAVERALSEGRSKPVPMNIDGATAVIYAELGFTPELGRGLFILSRSVGILAHAAEQATMKERIKGPLPPQFLYTYEGPAERHVKTPA